MTPEVTPATGRSCVCATERRWARDQNNALSEHWCRFLIEWEACLIYT